MKLFERAKNKGEETVLLGGVTIVVWPGDKETSYFKNRWYGCVVCGQYRSKSFTTGEAFDASHAARMVLEDWFKEAGIELVMTRQLYFAMPGEM